MTTTKTVTDPKLAPLIQQFEATYRDFQKAEGSGDILRAIMDMEERNTLAEKYPLAWAAFAKLHGHNPDGSPISG